MPQPKVDDPKQNQHLWWGTIKIDYNEKENGDTHGIQHRGSEYLHVFIKTTRETHFISHGTVIGEVKFLSEDDDTAVKAIIEEGNVVDKNTIDLIRSDLALLEGQKVCFYTIEEIDRQKTSPLARKLNAITEECFNDELWLSGAGSIGAASIRIGRELPRLESLSQVPKSD